MTTSGVRSPKARRLLFALLLLVPCIGCDRVTKGIAVEHLAGREPISLLGDTIRVQYALNKGAFLGLGSVMSDEARFWTLTVGTAVFLVILAGLLVAHWDMNARRFAALALILAGGTGNLIDRAHQGFVVDFLNVGVGPLRTGIFNVADVAITAGVIWLLFTGSGEEYPDGEVPEPEPEPEAPPA